MTIAGHQAKFRTFEDFRSLYMPFDHLLLFGGDGGGDLFAYPVRADGSTSAMGIFVWEHEDDSRTWRASSLRDLHARLSTDWVGNRVDR